MVDLNKLQNSLSENSRLPLEQWNPPFCGDIDILITSQGDWLYQGSKITRPALVKLFASVLWREQDDYYLLTPVEKVRIRVEDLPFIVVGWRRLDDGTIEVTTDINEHYRLGQRFPLVSNNSLPAVKIRDGFLARVHRNVYYQWAEEADLAHSGEPDGFYLQSADARFLLGPAS